MFGTHSSVEYGPDRNVLPGGRVIFGRGDLRPASAHMVRFLQGLAVESQEVIPIEAKSTDRRFVIQTTVRTMPVVMV